MSLQVALYTLTARQDREWCRFGSYPSRVEVVEASSQLYMIEILWLRLGVKICVS